MSRARLAGNLVFKTGKNQYQKLQAKIPVM